MELSNKKYAILISSIMFIWSGINKILNFNKKVEVLSKKTNLNKLICDFGMIMVILLEIFGFLILIEYFFNKKYLCDIINKFVKIEQEKLVKFMLVSLLLFLIVVTIIYHPPSLKKPIPFLSNLTTFGLFLYVYYDLFQ